MTSIKPSHIEINLFFFQYKMVSVISTNSLVFFTSPLASDAFVLSTKDLMGLRFHFQIGTMYDEQELFNENGFVLKKTSLYGKLEMLVVQHDCWVQIASKSLVPYI